MLWEIDIYPASGLPDRISRQLTAEAADAGLAGLCITAARGYLIEGDLDAEQAELLAHRLLADPVVETTVVAETGQSSLETAPQSNPEAAPIHVLPLPGVTDPVAESVLQAAADLGIPLQAARTLRKYWVSGATPAQRAALAARVLSNNSIEQTVDGPLRIERLQMGAPAEFKREVVLLLGLNDEQLMRLSVEGQLHLTLPEMQTIQRHFQELDREPTDAELETVAQTWSEHCSHKTLAGRIAYRDECGERTFENMLKETIFAATVRIRELLQDDDWCVSVFEDNAGIVRFDERHNVAFKVETHNHPSAIEPYGGSNTGIGGVIRDTLGTGLGAKPVANTDVFCFAPPDTDFADLPPNTLHPRRIMQGVVAGVRDYGNRMGIPTVNGAICFDPRYVGNPLVYCGNVGVLPQEMSFKAPLPSDWIVSIGGRTGRDGIHGATFSSAPMTSESESISGGAVQIGNAITEKMVLDVMLQARDRGLFTAVTDCGAGGFSSAVGEMGEHIGAEVYLERAPLKYDGLTYTEIWISEAQERMVFSVSPDKWDEFEALCRSEGVEATIIGKFVPSGRLRLLYQDHEVADLPMSFLHDGRPPVVRDAVYEAPKSPPLVATESQLQRSGELLLEILGSLNVCSKEWVIRQYDHEVQGGSVVKPLVGRDSDGPSDAAVLRPVLDSSRGLVIGCGINPCYGDYDTYDMAASAIDEAIRNCVAVGADPDRIAILDNFCWGHTDHAETLGSLVRAALACQDVSIAMLTPFISGKDSLNNEFHYTDDDGEDRAIAIPPTLLISALGQVPDVSLSVTMDLKRAGSQLFLVGVTRDELGGSQWSQSLGLPGGAPPELDAGAARQSYLALHRCMQRGLVRACHDLSEGGLAVAAAEMAFAGGLGVELQLAAMRMSVADVPAAHLAVTKLFAESNSRLLCEVSAEDATQFVELLEHAAVAKVGEVTDGGSIRISDAGQLLLDVDIEAARAAWKAPLDWQSQTAD